MKDYRADFRILERPVLVTGIGVAFSKADDRGLAQRLSVILEQMRRDGTMQRMVGKYLDDPETFLEVEKLEY